MHKTTLALAWFAGLFITTPLWAASLEIVDIDFGNPSTPTEGAPLPGETGHVYFTLRNAGREPFNDLTLRGTAGTCVTELSPTLRMASLSAGATVRVEIPLSLTLSAACRPGQLADLLLSGAYSAVDGQRRPTWATHSFYIPRRRPAPEL